VQVFTAIEAMADGGVMMGLPRDLAIKLAAQTMLVSIILFIHFSLQLS
jgi:pyrroline-5-carboxylate reductase